MEWVSRVNIGVFLKGVHVIYHFSHNHGRGNLPQMKGTYSWRETLFTSHDYGMQGMSWVWFYCSPWFRGVKIALCDDSLLHSSSLYAKDFPEVAERVPLGFVWWHSEQQLMASVHMIFKVYIYTHLFWDVWNLTRIIKDTASKLLTRLKFIAGWFSFLNDLL